MTKTEKLLILAMLLLTLGGCARSPDRRAGPKPGEGGFPVSPSNRYRRRGRGADFLPFLGLSGLAGFLGLYQKPLL